MTTQAKMVDEVAAVTCRLSGWQALFNAAFVRQWESLAANCVEPNAFCESWFLAPALRQFDRDNRVQIFTLWDGTNLCGLMPISVKAHYGRWWLPHMQNWLHHNAFLGVPLVRAGYEQIFWRTLLETLDAQAGSALFAHLCSLPADGRLTAALSYVAHEQGRRFARVECKQRAFLQSENAPTAYFQQAVRPKKRKELARQKSRLGEKGALTFIRCDGASGLDKWTEEFLALEQRGWKGTNRSALASANDTRNLFTEVLKGAAFAGKLERLDLRLDGRPLAMLVNFLCPPGSFSFKTAFDEEYARFSPGVLLQIENLALLERADIEWCDSCAAQGHPMIDSLWTGRRNVGRYSVAIGGPSRRAIFGSLLNAELARQSFRSQQATAGVA